MLIREAMGGTASLSTVPPPVPPSTPAAPMAAGGGTTEAAGACGTLLEAAGFLLAFVGCFLKALNEDTVLLLLLQDVTFVVLFEFWV